MMELKIMSLVLLISTIYLVKGSRLQSSERRNQPAGKMRMSYVPLRLSLVLALMITKQQQTQAKPLDCDDVCKELETMLGTKRYNCIRLCDSVNDNSKRASFMRIGRASFMRIGRSSGGQSDDNDLQRDTRPYLYNIKRPSFMRIGKKSETEGAAEKRASFMRIGKKSFDDEEEKRASFMRIGKKSDDAEKRASFMRIGKKSQDEMDGEKRASFMRIGRSSER